MLESSLLSKGFYYYHGEDVCFTYQRMGDYFVANNMLKGCKTEKEAKKQLKKYTTILVDKILFEGVLEQLFVLVPEQFGVEIWKVADLRKERKCVRMLLDSLRWRSVKSVNEEEIIKYLQKHGVSKEGWMHTLLFLSPIPNHPFNGDRWNRIMKRLGTMANRDAFLQPLLFDILWYHSSDNNIQRLIDWAWMPGISKICDKEVARLVGITLAWILSSTSHALQNNTTKALVNLLQHQPEVLLAILEEFRDVDDPYIQERLMAVAYGCVLRCGEKEAVCAIAKWVYDVIFANGNPPRHILIRDYACNIVDYAHRQSGLIEVDEQKYLPPYNAEMPQLPSESDVNKYKVDYNNKTEKYANEQNAILLSLYGGMADFGNKIVDYGIHSFVPWSFRLEDELQTMLKSGMKLKRQLLDTYVEASIQKIKANESNRSVRYKDGMIDDLTETIISMTREGLQTVMSQDEIDRLDDVLIPNRALIGTSHYLNRLDTHPYRYWIVQRVFEMGYDRTKHGRYDSDAKRIEGYNVRHISEEGRVERLGKKYQWIAYYELLGCFADNFHIEDPWETSKELPYDGAWEDSLRDFDPVCITKRDKGCSKDNWMSYQVHIDWNMPSQDWLRDVFTLDEVRQMIVRTDNDGNQWFTLHDNDTHRAPSRVGDNPYHYQSFFDYQIAAYIIRKEDKERVVRLAGHENFLHYEMARPVDSSLKYITREKYWSRACKVDKSATSDLWVKLHNRSDIDVIVPYVAMSGNCDEDFMATNAWYAMPIEQIFNGMQLSYAEIDGDFINRDGRLIATCNPDATRHFLMNRDALASYLQVHGWDIVWIVNMERYFTPDVTTFMNAEVWQHSGLFYIDDNGDIQGTFKIQNRNAHEDTSDTDASW